MALQNIEARVKKVVAENAGVKIEEVANNMKFTDLAIDEKDQRELLIAFEEEFDVEIDDVDGFEIYTVQQAIDYFKTR